MRKRKLVVAGICGLLLCMTGCGKSSSDAAMNETAASADYGYGVYSDYGYSEEMPEEYVEDTMGESDGQADTVGENAQTTERKLIRTVEMDVETQNFENILNQVEQKVTELGGYVENSSLNQNSMYSQYRNRSAEYTVRIPEERLDEFVQMVEEGTNVTYRQNSVEDVTLSYVDLESHKEALETEETRLLELLEQAEDMADILAIESQLSNVRYQLDSMESQLRTKDNQVDYATIYLYISEVERLSEIPDETAWSRITTGFVNSIYDIGVGIREAAIWFVIHLPYLLVWGIVITGAVLIVRLIWKKCHRRKMKKAEAAMQREQKKTDAPQ